MNNVHSCGLKATQKEFIVELRSITFIGPSRAGKSTQSRLISAELGLPLVCCDQLIEDDHLKPYLKLAGYGEGLSEVGRWLGKPGDPQYRDKAQMYLDFEMQVMYGVCTRLIAGELLVVDTTGSVIYMPLDILSLLRGLSIVVKIDTPPHLSEELLASYEKEDPPVIWADGTYEPVPGEEARVARARCYKNNLLTSREVLYNLYAHRHLDYSWLRESGRATREVVDKIFG